MYKKIKNRDEEENDKHDADDEMKDSAIERRGSLKRSADNTQTTVPAKR